MIQWGEIGINALWILGVALALAALSYRDWGAHRRGVPRLQALSAPVFLAPFAMGIVLVCVSLFFKARSPLERACWAVCSVLLTGQSIFWLRVRGE